MTRVRQVLVGASPGDAVTEHALEIHRTLEPVADAELLALYIDPELYGRIRPLRPYLSDGTGGSSDDLLLVHVSIGQPEVAAWVMHRRERVAIYYHNISPSAAFERYAPEFAELLEEGRAELGAYAARAELALAASAFNARELESLGFNEVRVSPLLFDPWRLLEITPDEPTETHLATRIEGPVVLFVGQLLPHKRPDFLLQAYFSLCTHLLPKTHLIMVGAGRIPSYAWALQTYVNELNANHAWLTGHVSDSMLAAFYRRADVFATASEHEGFCAPLVEAMAFDLPVVARSFAAIPETLAGAGLILSKDDGPAVLAEALAEVLTQPDLSSELVERGRRRVKEIDAGEARSILFENLRELL